MKRIMGYALLCAPFVLYGLAVVLSVYGIDPLKMSCEWITQEDAE